MTSIREQWLRGRKPELGEVLPRRLKDKVFSSIQTVYTETGLTEEHTDIVMEAIPLQGFTGVYLCKLASGATSLIARSPTGELVPACVAAVLKDGER